MQNDPQAMTELAKTLEWLVETLIQKIAERQKKEPAIPWFVHAREIARTGQLVPAQSGPDRYPLCAYVWKRGPHDGCPEGEWVLEIEGAINDMSFVTRHTEPLTTPPEEVPGLPSLYSAQSSDAAMTGAKDAEPYRAHSIDLIEAIAQWERENGSIVAITPNEYAGFVEALKTAAAVPVCSARAALAERKEAP